MKKMIAGAAAGSAAVAAYLLVIRPWHQRWGATDAELVGAIPGDDLVEDPSYVTTRAVSIKACPDDIWPGLMQMGYGRGAMYTYDWIDRILGILDRPSADEILPEFQHLEVGDVIPMGSGPSWPVKSIEPYRSLVLDIKGPGVHVTWSILLDEVEERHTRLILRIRGRLEMTPVLVATTPITDAGEFIMVRGMLLGIKRRAEATARERAAVHSHDAATAG